MVKRLIQSALRKTLKVEIRKLHRPYQTPDYPLIAYSPRRLRYFYDLLIKLKYVEGDVVECGVSQGYSLFSFALLTSFLKPRHIYGFDSFQGLPEPSPEDKPQRHVVKGNMDKGLFAASKEYVVEKFLANGVPPDFMDNRITLVEGFFPDTFHEYNGSGIALLHLDVDLYQSYKQTLEYFYPKVNKGGIIAFDEYQDPLYVGATKAIDEFLHGKEQISKCQFIDQYFIVKE